MSKYRGVVRGHAVTKTAKGDGSGLSECIIEVADVPEALQAERSGGVSSSRAKVALQQLFKRFGPVLDVTIGPADYESISTVRFANARSAEAAMVAAGQGFLPVGHGEVRVRYPAAKEQIWRKFAPSRKIEDNVMPKKKLRPNERFASRLPANSAEEPDESERFWDAQQQQRGKPGAPPIPTNTAPSGTGIPRNEPAPDPPAPVAPDKPIPSQLTVGASDEDKAVFKGEEEVARDMNLLLEKPFSQQKKALKAIRLQWHPDKNPDRAEVATRVFQFIQSHDEWLAHHNLA